MKDIIIKFALLIIVIITSYTLYSLFREREQLKKEGFENKIINTNNVITKTKLQNLSIMASYNSATLNENVDIQNLKDVMATGTRWLDFEVNENNDKPNVPFVSGILPLKTVLREIKLSNGVTPNSQMPIFINLRIDGKHSEAFYNNIHSTILLDDANTEGTFTRRQLYDSPGPLRTLLNDTKESVMSIVKKVSGKYKKTTNDFDKKETFQNKDNLGTENELYENYTFIDNVYKPSIKEGFDGTDDDEKSELDIKTQEAKIKNLEKKLKDLGKEIKKLKTNKIIGSRGARRLIVKANKEKIGNFEKQYKTTTDELKEAKKTLADLDERREADDAAEKNIGSELNTFKTENKKIEKDSLQQQEDYREAQAIATEPVAGAGKHAQNVIDKLRTENSSKDLDIAIMNNKIGSLKQSNKKYEILTRDHAKSLNDANDKIENALTKQLKCKRCITGDTILGEIGNKIVIILTRNNNIVDDYSRSKLNFSNDESVINMEIHDYNRNNNISSNKPYLMSYSKNNFKNTSQNKNFLVTHLRDDFNFDRKLQESINNKNIQIIQVSNLVARTKYLEMFNFYNSAFISNSDAIKYLQR